jgi:hypothetical protein
MSHVMSLTAQAARDLVWGYSRPSISPTPPVGTCGWRGGSCQGSGHAGHQLTQPPLGTCRFCGDDTWLADDVGPVHP